VGETFRHFIGCYLFGFEAEGEQQPTYIALPSNLEWLEREVRQYLQEFVDEHPHASEVAIRPRWPICPNALAAHVAGGMGNHSGIARCEPVHPQRYARAAQGKRQVRGISRPGVPLHPGQPG
jgi:hypothetical protein